LFDDRCSFAVNFEGNKKKYMTFQEFLTKAHDRSVSTEYLKRYFRETMHHNLAYDNLDEENKDFVLDIILKHRAKLLTNEHSSSTDIEREYYRIWERRESLHLLENDLKNIKDILHSFQSE